MRSAAKSRSVGAIAQLAQGLQQLILQGGLHVVDAAKTRSTVSGCSTWASARAARCRARGSAVLVVHAVEQRLHGGSCRSRQSRRAVPSVTTIVKRADDGAAAPRRETGPC